jgi:hypothetical protein
LGCFSKKLLWTTMHFLRSRNIYVVIEEWYSFGFLGRSSVISTLWRLACSIPFEIAEEVVVVIQYILQFLGTGYTNVSFGVTHGTSF